MKASYIGVFDSGVGGLSVLKELLKKFPKENFIYLGDTARLPYGAKSSKTIANYVTKNLNHLNQNYNLKAIVVACNSASSVLNEVQSETPLVGVIHSGVQAALKASQNFSKPQLGLWATRATVASQAYQNLISLKGFKVQSVSCPMLVSMVESGLDHELYEPAFKHYFSHFTTLPNVLILGCTHFPLFKTRLKNFLVSQSYEVELVDASSEIGAEIVKHLEAFPYPKNTQRSVKVLLTDQTDHFKNFVDLLLKDEASYSIETIDL